MQVDWGRLRRLEPVSRHFGYDRGTPVDRWYIERFLAANSESIRGRVLEIGDDTYTRRFGGHRVTRSDTFHAHAGNPGATWVGDLAAADTIPSGIYDCAIVTQTLQMIPDCLAALRTLRRILRPNGVLLLTVPGITPVSSEADEWSKLWNWSFTPAGVHHMVREVFPNDENAIEVHGNVFAATCVLQGIALEDVIPAELEAVDAEYTVLITLRSRKPAG